MAPAPDKFDHDALAEMLRALAYPARLELMELVRLPKSVPEIRLSARRGADGSRPAPPATRQTIAAHLAKLVDVDLVREERSKEGAREVVRYRANARRAFDALEGLRRLTVLAPPVDDEAEATMSIQADSPAATARGPRLVVARGIEEGRVYPLTKKNGSDAGWFIGRRAGHSVELRFDGYASSDNSVIQRAGRGQFAVADLGSKNGTSVNWSPLVDGEQRDLRPGDIISVGRSLLVFATK